MGIKKPHNTSEPPQSSFETGASVERPVIDLGACSRCGGCVEIAPGIFRFNEGGGYIEISELPHYDRELVDEAIKYCPEDCIYWENHE